MRHGYRFYLPPHRIEGDTARFDPAESHHMKAVLRLSFGDEIEATDGRGNLFRIRLDHWEDRAVVGKILQGNEVETRSPAPIEVALPCLKGDRWRIAVEGVCDLGVHAVRLVHFHRSQARWTPIKADKAERKAVEILKQSSGCRLTAVHHPVALSDLLEQTSFPEVIVADQNGQPPEKVPEGSLVIIGPEVGFSREEDERLNSARCRRFRFGSRRLRSEIAAITAAAVMEGIFAAE
jgi:16S rRNA (uracil1498-N3)-methyltransferase